MESFDNVLAWSLNRYFVILEHTGYINDQMTFKLVLLSFIEEFLNKYQGYITEEDYAKVNKIVSCIADNSCLVPYGDFKKPAPILVNYIYNTPIRISETDFIRNTEPEETLRLTNQ